MLRISKKEMEHAEGMYPGIAKQIRTFEAAVLPACAHCGSDNTADVQCGVIGRTMCIASATTKFKLLMNGPLPGRYFCNACRKYFGKKSAPIRARRKKSLTAEDLVDLVDKYGGFTVSLGAPKRRAKRKA